MKEKLIFAAAAVAGAALWAWVLHAAAKAISRASWPS